MRVCPACNSPKVHLRLRDKGQADMSRFLAVLSLLFFLGTGAFVSDAPAPLNTSQLVTQHRPVDLPKLPHSLGTGELVLTGGWELRSKNSSFGGFSALQAVGNGRLLALSDAAVMAGFTLTNGPVTRDSFVAPLPVRKGEPSNKMDQDSESLTFDPATGRYWVGYEQRHRIRRFAPAFARAQATGKPAVMQDWPDNGGVEAMVRRDDGSFLVFSESRSLRPGVTVGLIFASDPAEPGAKVQGFAYQPPKGFRITDIAELPDGRFITLHRRFDYVRGVVAKVGIIEPAQIGPDRLVVPRVIATFEPPLPVDNMEGIAVEQQSGKTIIWMISDDNYFPVQRTLLLRFDLNDSSPAPFAKQS